MVRDRRRADQEQTSAQRIEIKRFSDRHFWQVGYDKADPRDVFTLQEVLARESRERGSRKTMQEALEEMVRDYCKKHGVKLPSASVGKE